jgi:hypothetical protein
MEHRWGDRIPVDIPIRIMGDGPSLVCIGRLINISMSGALIATALEPRVLSRIRVIWSLRARLRHHLPAVAACVVRESSEGIAVEWCDFGAIAVVQTIQAAASYPLIIAEQPRTGLAQLA